VQLPARLAAALALTTVLGACTAAANPAPATSAPVAQRPTQGPPLRAPLKKDAFQVATDLYFVNVKVSS
jgi:hypothetical protein